MRRTISIFSITLAITVCATACSLGRVNGSADGPTSTATPVSTAVPVTVTAGSADDSRSSGDVEQTDQLARCEEQTPSDIGEPGTSIQFYATCGGTGDAPYPIYRDRSSLGLADALQHMTNGLTPSERNAGLFSWFDSDDAITASASVDQAGVVSVRFEQGDEPWRPTASTSYQVMSLLDPLGATIFGFPAVQGIDMTGLCFGDIDCTGTWTRNDFEQTQFLNHGVISSRSCGNGGYWDQPNHCNVDALRNAGPLHRATVTGVAADDTLNLRAGPWAGAFIIANNLRTGSVVQATEIVREAEDGGRWQLIFDPADRAGWVNSAFLDSSVFNTELDERILLADRFVAFAKDRSSESFAKLTFTERVQLGLGPQILVEVERNNLQKPDVWSMDVDYFRAYVGPFSIIEPLQRLTRWQVDIGPHKHCAGDPMPVPVGLERATIVSIQPAMATIDSCLQWFAVDLFIDEDGRIQAVTFDTWEP